METQDRSGLIALEPLDVASHSTVGKLVDGMSRCSFGARMLGDVAASLTEWALDPLQRAPIIYDGKLDTPLGNLLKQMVERKWFTQLMKPEDYFHRWPTSSVGPNALVVGHYSDRFASIFTDKPNRAIFINQFGMARPGQIRDGYFPDAVFSDPNLIMPIINAVLEERLEKSRVSVTQLIAELEGFGGMAAEVADGAQTLRTMVADPDTTVLMTLSGAMTPAKMGLIICDFIDRGWTQYIASTGALMAHGLVEGMGLLHYRYDPTVGDDILAERLLNRITDVLEPEENLNAAAELIDLVLNNYPSRGIVTSPIEFHHKIGQLVHERMPDQRGILKSAYLKNVPIAVPGFVDSELGNDVNVHNRRRARDGHGRIIMDMEADSNRLVDIALGAKRLAIFSVGGGVPRNNTQNVAPLIEIIGDRLGISMPTTMFSLGCRICPDAPWFGHLSGCTYAENTSWRKMDPEGIYSEVHTDATIVLPLFTRFLMENIN
jgi:deoxyhypusine synthase